TDNVPGKPAAELGRWAATSMYFSDYWRSPDKIVSLHNRLRLLTRRVPVYAVVSACVLAAACDGAETIWSREVRSPDGQWVAAAHTDRYSGPGNAAIITAVTLRRTSGRAEPIDVLSLEQNADTVGLTMTWPTASRLDLTYHQPAAVDFQAVRAGGVEITLRDVSGAIATTPPRP
ncbi:MAG: hypothetical protein M3065_00655, partial [Actinomycetota bacterium]|nr:hypothetical protein [Actinomycetota bacterium]